MLYSSKLRVLFYQTASGRAPVKEEIDSLPVKAQSDFYELMDTIEEYGVLSGRLDFRHIQGKLWEIRVELAVVGSYRIFYCIMDGSAMILLHSYAKRSQKAPKRHIETALLRMHDALNRGLK